MDDVIALRLLDDLAKRFGIVSLLNKYINILDYEIIHSHEKLPSWWSENNNVMLCPKNRQFIGAPFLQLHPGYEKCANFILICNEEHDYAVMLWGDGGLMYVAPEATINGSGVALGSGCIFYGPLVRHTARLNLNCRNGGRIILQRDILIASDVSIQTDDCHTLYSIADGKRKNPYGGKIDVEEHVWIGQQSIVMGDSRIGRNSVIGARSFVRGANFPDNVVLAGSPARVVTEGVNWDFRDLPPDAPVFNAS